MARSRARRILIAVALVALLAAAMPFINVGRFKSKITPSIEGALGRRVTVGGLSLQLLPRPGFILQRFAVSDADEFGAEPMLRAEEVTAYLRLSSLWHGRLEVAKLSLKFPSLNLVRASDGRWNIEALLERASQTPTAPTAQSKPEARPRFPYIEADTGRINLKLGQEKKVYALSEADFSLWLASENEWGMRLRARPVRTDTNVTDTGTLRVDGKFQRAHNLRETPLEFRVALERAQLGSLTKLLYGKDRGWRGGLDVNALLSGSPGALKIAADAMLDDFRRYDIGSGEALRLRARCTAAYSTATQAISELDCAVPMDTGRVLAQGELPLRREEGSKLTVTAKKVPAQMLVALARRAKQGMAEGLSAKGELDAVFNLQNLNGHATWTGGGSTSTLQLESRSLRTPLMVGPVQFALDNSQPTRTSDPGGLRAAWSSAEMRDPGAALVIKRFSIAMGGDEPAAAQARISRAQYAIELHGEAQARRLLQLAQAFGVRSIAANVSGLVKMHLGASGKWAGFAAPLASGSLQLRNINVEIPGVAAPVQVASASLVLSPTSARMQNLRASVVNTKVAVSGWVETPRACPSVEDCPVTFDLRADHLSTDELNAIFNPRLRKRPWYKLMTNAGDSILTRLHAAGRIIANRVTLKSAVAAHVGAQVRLEEGKLKLINLTGEVFGGRHRGIWTANFTGDTPSWEFRGALDQIAMDNLARLMRDDWAGGTVSATYRGTATGSSAADLMDSATGTAEFHWRDGVLRHVALNGDSGPLRLRRFAGQIELADGILTLAKSQMETASGIYAVSGTASLGRKLELKLARGNAPAFTIGGTLEKPQVTPAAQEAAKLPEKIVAK